MKTLIEEKVYKFTDPSGVTHYLRHYDIEDTEGYCPICNCETEDRTKIYRGPRCDHNSMQIEPDEEIYYCNECGSRRV